MINPFSSSYITANNIQNTTYTFTLLRGISTSRTTQNTEDSITFGAYIHSLMPKCLKTLLKEGNTLKDYNSQKTIVTKHVVLQINPDVTVPENRCYKDHSLEREYKLSTHIIKPF